MRGETPGFIGAGAGALIPDAASRERPNASPAAALRRGRRALVIIPGTTNYFYNQSGRRVAEALGGLGLEVDVTTLTACPVEDYEYCLISNIAEVVHAFGGECRGIDKIRSLRPRWGSVACLSIDCVQTCWYQKIRELSERAGVERILDLGLYAQSDFLESPARAAYRFVFSGLTESEARSLDAAQARHGERPIPWAFVGHATPARVALVDELVRALGGGFVYMPELASYTEKGSPHLNQQQFERVLERTRYQFWCSHHAHFYVEPERFRVSLLTGGVPVKIVGARRDVPESVPFAKLFFEVSNVGALRQPGLFATMREQFQAEWRGFPSLASELARVLGVPAPAASAGRGVAA